MNRKARFAGTWYPDAPQQLRQIVHSATADEQRYRMAILPHAGLAYSGTLISSFFQALEPGVNKVIILAPSHYHYLPARKFCTADFMESETPLGNVPTQPLITDVSYIDDSVVQDEHALEMFLPFIAENKNLSVSYAVTGPIESVADIKRMAQAVLPLVGPDVALVGSSDFTHYGKRFGYAPYGWPAEQQVVAHDLACAQLLADGDVEKVYNDYFRSCTICGLIPAMIVSEVAKTLGLHGAVMGHDTSLDEISRKGRPLDFVSYVNIFWRN